ncbi:MAG: hypothetical protein HY859_16390 [Caulobacterales bacterium]|nr:hypothetical protein [Caulobacterales bacterium]
MRKTALILAGAMAFDLGVLVVAGQAAEAPKSPNGAPAPTTVRKSDDYLKIKLTEVLVSSYAIDRTHTAKGCEAKLGKVIDVAGMPVCQLPAAPAPAPR